MLALLGVRALWRLLKRGVLRPAGLGRVWPDGARGGIIGAWGAGFEGKAVVPVCCKG